MLFERKKSMSFAPRHLEVSRLPHRASFRVSSHGETYKRIGIVDEFRDGCGASHLLAEGSQTANAGTNEVQRAPTRAIRFLRFQSSLTHFHPFVRPPVRPSASAGLPSRVPNRCDRGSYTRDTRRSYPSVQGAPNVARISLTTRRGAMFARPRRLGASLASNSPNGISNRDSRECLPRIMSAERFFRKI